jgi:hypothetical protein
MVKETKQTKESILGELSFKSAILELMLSEYKESTLRVERDVMLKKMEKEIIAVTAKEKHNKKKAIQEKREEFKDSLKKAKDGNKVTLRKYIKSLPDSNIEEIFRNMYDLVNDFMNCYLDSERFNLSDKKDLVAALLKVDKDGQLSINGERFRIFIQKK